MADTPKRYRPNAAIIVTDGQGRILLCERTQVYTALQTVQGGIDPGETPRQAAARELQEELGLAPAQFEIIGEMPGTVRYDWPAAYAARLGPKSAYQGQEQAFFLARVSPDVSFRLDAHEREFAAVRWGMPQELLDGAWPPKRPGFERALRHFGLL